MQVCVHTYAAGTESTFRRQGGPPWLIGWVAVAPPRPGPTLRNNQIPTMKTPEIGGSHTEKNRQ